MKGCVCLLALCSLVLYSSAAYGQTPKKDDRSAEWEYKQLGNPSDDLLNHYAKNGWEIGAAAGGANEYSIFYKAWPGYSESWELYNSPSLSCEGFTFQAHGGGGFIFITLTDLSYKKIADERKRTNLAKKLGELKL
jgi:hypothetical protein